MEIVSGSLVCVLGLILFMGMIFLASSFRIVQEEKRLSVYRLGRYLGDKGPGLVMLIPIIDRGVLKEAGATGKIPGLRFTGAVGEARTPVYREGRVVLAGEEWDAMSQDPISAGQRVRVVRVIVEVEKE
jgi:membrane-bound ClpP family serine protease